MGATARRLCLVTGASAGIGAALARRAAAAGYDLALTARRADRLEALARELQDRFGVQAFAIPADLAAPDASERILAAVATRGRVVDAVVNNAGYSLSGFYAEQPWAALDSQLQVMLTAVCELTWRVLPGMQARGFGRVLNVASVAGLIPGAAGATLYGPIKSFLIKFSQGLHLENLKTGVNVTALCPGYTLSEFHDVTGTRAALSRTLPGWMWLTAEAVADAGWRAVEAGRPVSVPGMQYKALLALARLLPEPWLLALMAREGERFRPR